MSGISPLYQAVFDEYVEELNKSSEELFLYKLPFTQVNRLAMLAATVAERCVRRLALSTDAGENGEPSPH